MKKEDRDNIFVRGHEFFAICIISIIMDDDTRFSVYPQESVFNVIGFNESFLGESGKVEVDYSLLTFVTRMYIIFKFKTCPQSNILVQLHTHTAFCKVSPIFVEIRYNCFCLKFLFHFRWK